jgi:hypothetical protein
MGLFKRKKERKNNPYSDYLYNIYPFLLGCLISWIYTYHLRKREFWIMVGVLVIVNYQVKKRQRELARANNEEETEETELPVELS